jgi:hypothetical protein
LAKADLKGTRDAICAHETHLQARPASAARLKRCEGRGSAHRNRAEPEAARQVPLPATAIGGAGLSRIAGVAGDLMACKNGVALELAECGHQIGDQIIPTRHSRPLPRSPRRERRWPLIKRYSTPTKILTGRRAKPVFVGIAACLTHRRLLSAAVYSAASSRSARAVHGLTESVGIPLHRGL